MRIEWVIWRVCLYLKKSPEEVDEGFTFIDLMKFNALLDREDDSKAYQAGINYFESKRKTKD